MKLLSTAQMRTLDRHGIDDLGISGLALMERANSVSFSPTPAITRWRWY